MVLPFLSGVLADKTDDDRHNQDQRPNMEPTPKLNCPASSTTMDTAYKTTNKLSPSTGSSIRSNVPRRTLLAGAALLAGALGCQALPGRSGEAGEAGEAAVLVPPLMDMAELPPAAGTSTSDTTVFAGGCFWGVQGVFQHVLGVIRAVSGYAGGDAGTANYDAAGSGRTGHAEAVRISFDPRRVSFAQLLQIHFSVAHDPRCWWVRKINMERPIGTNCPKAW